MEVFMKFLTALLLSSFIILFLFSSDPFAQNLGAGSISGTIKSEIDKLPIKNAWVVAFDMQNVIKFKQHISYSDAVGGYKINNLPQGQYRVYVRADSFVSEFYNNVRNPMLATPVKIDNNAEVTGINFDLVPGATISGRVTDKNGAGIADVLVVATPFDSYPQFGWLDSLMLWGADLTDEDGYYKMNTLEAGKYRVAAKLQTKQPPFFTIQYWENTYNFNEADPVEVKSGQVIPDINFKFDISLPKGGIAGTVTDAKGNPLAGVWVFAWQATSKDSFFRNFRGFYNLEKTDNDGKYEIEQLSPGKYYVSATRMDWLNYQTIWYDGVTSMEKATPVPVADTTTTGIDFVFDSAANLGSISGKVISDVDSQPISDAFVSVMWVGSYVGQGRMHYRSAMYAWTNANGEYKIDALDQGKYIVLVHKNGYTEFYDNAQDIEKATEVEVKAGTETTGINFSIPPDQPGSKIAGIVTDDSTGAPIVGALITLFPADSSYSGTFRGKFTLFDYYATISDSNGKYLLGGIPKGKYLATCWAAHYIVEFYNNKSTPWNTDKIDLDGVTEKSGIDFTLTPGCAFKNPGQNLTLGTLSGQVTDHEGRFVANAYVSIVDQNQQIQASEITGADGRYTMVGLPVGEYYVKVDRMPYNSTYYGNVTALHNATPINIGETGNFNMANIDVVLTPAQVSSVEENNQIKAGIPRQIELSQNYPNPFNPRTMIQYALPIAGYVTLKIYNLQGELVKTLVDGYQAAKYHQVGWNGEDEAGKKVAAGIYLYQLRADNYKQTMRLILLK